MDLDKLCISCMREKGGREVCPLCGYEEADKDGPSIFLPPRTVLVDKYLIGRVLGQGGFGITYLARDINLDIKIAVKEFFPQGLVSRGPTSKDVVSFTGEMKQQFTFGLERFLHEARILARFADHPNIVTVRDFFRANGTAYMVMNYIEGVTLEEYLDQAGGKLSFKENLEIMMPVLDALKEVHLAGIMHRDISPDNIFIDSSGRVVLIDFGAARQEMQQKGRGLSVILKAGYAPEEQYRSRGEQGPWTDVYATAATMYRVITGQVPMESMDRLAEDNLVSPSDLGADIEPHQEQTLLKAMALRAKDRYRTIEEFQDKLIQGAKLIEREGRLEAVETKDSGQQEALGETVAEPLEEQTTPKDLTPDSSIKTKKTPYDSRKKSLIILAGVVLFLLFLRGGIWLIDMQGPWPFNENNNDQQDNQAGEIRGEEVVIGSKDYTEQILLGQIAIQVLEHHDIPTVDRLGYGGTMEIRNALEAGEIDLYWEYTGTATARFMEVEPSSFPLEAYSNLSEWDYEENGLVWLDYTPYNNTYVLMMLRDNADKLGLETISDLAETIRNGVESPVPGGWSFAAEARYLEQLYPGLREKYWFEFDDLVTTELWRTYGALRDGEVAVASGFASNWRFVAFDLVKLVDDAHYHEANNCAPVVRAEVLEDYPDIKDLLNPIVLSLDETVISEMVLAVEQKHEMAGQVVEEWLIEQGFIEH